MSIVHTQTMRICLHGTEAKLIPQAVALNANNGRCVNLVSLAQGTVDVGLVTVHLRSFYVI